MVRSRLFMVMKPKYLLLILTLQNYVFNIFLSCELDKVVYIGSPSY